MTALLGVVIVLVVFASVLAVAEASISRMTRVRALTLEAEGQRKVTLIASGSEVSLALAARDLLQAEGAPTAVVSMPCFELFAQQEEAWQAVVLGGALRVGIEAACGFGGERWLGLSGIFVGMTGFGASGPYEKLYRHFGITPEAVAAAVTRRLS